jgi:integrase
VANFESYRTKSGTTGWVARIRLKGFRPHSKAFPTRRDAVEWSSAKEAELRALRDRGGARADIGTVTIRRLIERYLADPSVTRLKWHGQLSAMLAVWADEFGGMRVRSFGRLQVEAMRDKLLARRVGKGANARPLSNGRANRYAAAMRRAWRWGAARGYVLPSAVWPSEMMLTEAPAKEILATESEVALMFAACDRESAHLGALVRFLVGTGARLSDALAVRWRDVNEQRGDVAIRGQKTSRPLRVAMLRPARDALETAGAVKHVSGRVFWQYAHRMSPRHEWLKARVSFPEHMRKMRMHDCRHLCASLLAAHGATAPELAAQLGHATLTMVRRYSHLHPGHRGAAHDKLDRTLSTRR